MRLDSASKRFEIKIIFQRLSDVSPKTILKRIDACKIDEKDKIYTNIFNIILRNMQKNIFEVNHSSIGRRVKELRKQYY